jgi:putative oxidoreductase
MVDATPLIFPQLGPIYQALFPCAEALLRAVVGLTLVPHGLRSAFGMFPSAGAPSHNLTEFANELDRGGYHPGKFWAPAIVLTQLVTGPMLALGLFTRLAVCPIVAFLIVSNYERWRVGGFFWNKMGLEFTLIWTGGRSLFPGARRRRDLRRSPADRSRILTSRLSLPATPRPPSHTR